MMVILPVRVKITAEFRMALAPGFSAAPASPQYGARRPVSRLKPSAALAASLFALPLAIGPFVTGAGMISIAQAAEPPAAAAQSPSAPVSIAPAAVAPTAGNPPAVVDPTTGEADAPAPEAAKVPPPRTKGDIAEVIVTAPDYGSKEEVDEFHRQEFERLDKIYGRKETKETRSDVLSHASELDTGSTRNGMAADPLAKILNP